MDRVAVLGAGGHAKVVISTLQAAGYKVDAVYDDDSAKWGQSLLGVPVHGPLAELDNEASCRAVIAIGANKIRQELAQRFAALEWVTVVHPRAYVHPSASLGPGTVIFAGAVVQPDVRVGSHVIVNTGATVDHDCRLGDFVHLAPGVHLAGGVDIDTGTFFGTGAVAIPGIRIGAWTTVGAGAGVVRDLPAQVTAVGLPAALLHKEPKD